MTPFKTELSRTDKLVRTMANEYCEREDGNMSSAEEAILRVFVTTGANLSMPLSSIIDRAMACKWCLHSDVDQYQSAATRLARGKFLRSRVRQGVRHYEVAYTL